MILIWRTAWEVRERGQLGNFMLRELLGFEEGFVRGVFVGIFRMGVIKVPLLEIVLGDAGVWSVMMTYEFL